MTPLFRKILSANWLMLATIIGLWIFGLNAIRIAGETNPSEVIQNAWRSQLNYGLIGIVIYLGVSFVDYKWLRWVAIPSFLVSIGLLAAALIFGEEINDTKGWLIIGSFQFQPSQPAIAGAIVAASVAFAELRNLHPILKNHFVNLALLGIVTGIPFALVLKQGDVGSALVWIPVAAAIGIVGRIPFRHLAIVALIGVMVLPLFYFFGLSEQRQSRISVYLDMLQDKPVDIRGEGYAAHNISTAVGSGGLTGFKANSARATEAEQVLDPALRDDRIKKRDASMHEQGLIPRNTAHSDFIFGVIGERYGFRGAALLILAYLLLLIQTLFAAFCARDDTGRIFAAATTMLLFAHIFQNIGMHLLIMPITGIPLPFVSHGGTFLITIMGMLGIVQSIWIHRYEEPEKEEAERTVREARTRMQPI